MIFSLFIRYIDLYFLQVINYVLAQNVLLDFATKKLYMSTLLKFIYVYVVLEKNRKILSKL